MSTFFLIRHGLRVSRNEDTLLSKAGITQAELTGQYLQSQDISQLFVSPVSRTLHTAEIINRYISVPLSPDIRLKERIEFEPGSGNFEAFLSEWDKTMADRDYQPPYGDSARNSGERIKSMFDQFNDNKNYIFISHGGVIGDVVRNLFPENVLQFKNDPVKNLQWLEISECSITEIQKVENSYSLKRVNDTSHLSNFPNS